MNKTDFGMKFRVNPSTIDIDSDICNIIDQVRVASAESLDDAIVSEICKIAKEDGVNILFVLDKKNIRTALERATAKKPIDTTQCGLFPSFMQNCPTCGDGVIFSVKYCCECGQKLDWGRGK